MKDKKILVVDDTPEVARFLERGLKRSGNQILTAGDGEEALKMARSEKPHLIVLDIEMPKMDGFTFIRRMKKEPAIQSIPVIVLTAYVPMQDAFEIEGVFDYFVKSTSMKGFLEAVEQKLQTTEPKGTEPGVK